MSHRRRRIAAALAIVVAVIGAPIAWYLGSPVFLRTELHEPAVEAFAPGPTASTPTPRPTTVAPGREVSSPAASSPASAETPSEPAWTADPPRTGRFSGTDDFHFGRGTAILREVEPGRWVVRLEEFAVRNGPDLYVVLSPDAAGYAHDAIEVGRLKATDGSFNMRVPDGVDPSGVRSVLIWCKQFSHLFAVAPLEG